MIRHISIVLSVVLALILASCGDKQLDTIYDSQEGNIAAIVESLTKSNESATVERNNGTVRVTVVPGEGAPLGDNGAVAFYYAGFYITSRSLSNNTLFATNYESFANSAKWAVSDSAAFNIATIRLGEDEIVSGLRDGLVGVKGGEECYVLFNGKGGFGKKKIANIPSNAALAYHLWIKSVSND